MPAGVCGCCGPLRPRYKRLVDNIFPEDPKLLPQCGDCCGDPVTPPPPPPPPPPESFPAATQE